MGENVQLLKLDRLEALAATMSGSIPAWTAAPISPSRESHASDIDGPTGLFRWLS
jgi:hypothetical protein